MASLLVRDPFFGARFRLIDELMRAGGDGGVAGFTPMMDVRETTDEYLAIVDLPGVKSEDVTIEVNDQVLTLSGTRVPLETGEAQLLERPFGSFSRNLTLPRGVESDSIAADYNDGVLTLHIPKPANQKPKKIEITGSQKAINR